MIDIELLVETLKTPHTSQQLTQLFGIDKRTVSYHLRKLRLIYKIRTIPDLEDMRKVAYVIA